MRIELSHPTKGVLTLFAVGAIWLAAGVLWASLGMSVAHAELSLQQDRLTINVQEAPLEGVLKELSKLGAFEVTVLEDLTIEEETISARFEELPLEKAIDRLLAQWNFGMIKHKRTGKIREVFLASKHLSPEELPAPPVPEPKQSYPEFSEESEGEREGLSYFSPEGEWEEENDHESGEEGISIDFTVEGGELTEEMIPEDLPPEVREALLQEIEATRGERY